MRTSRVAGMHGEGRAAAQVSETLLQFRHERDDRELYRNRENTQGKGSFTLAVSGSETGTGIGTRTTEDNRCRYQGSVDTGRNR